MNTTQKAFLTLTAAATVALTGCATSKSADMSSPAAQRTFFYAGGTYTGEAGKEIMKGQMYVEKLVPQQVKQPFPLVLIHGAAQTATNWMMTPDGVG